MINPNEYCLLCKIKPEKEMHLTGQKIIKGQWLPYQLCKSCCKAEYNDANGQISRKKLWLKVEKKLLEKIKHAK